LALSRGQPRWGCPSRQAQSAIRWRLWARKGLQPAWSGATFPGVPEARHPRARGVSRPRGSRRLPRTRKYRHTTNCRQRQPGGPMIQWQDSCHGRTRPRFKSSQRYAGERERAMHSTEDSNQSERLLTPFDPSSAHFAVPGDWCPHWPAIPAPLWAPGSTPGHGVVRRANRSPAVCDPSSQPEENR
jgi:hypothetical protein